MADMEMFFKKILNEMIVIKREALLAEEWEDYDKAILAENAIFGLMKSGGSVD